MPKAIIKSSDPNQLVNMQLWALSHHEDGPVPESKMAHDGLYTIGVPSGLKGKAWVITFFKC